MGVRIIRKPKQLKLKVGKSATSSAVAGWLKDIAMYYLADIRDRSLKGNDINDKSFKPYTKSYRDSKVKKGASPTVNLRSSELGRTRQSGTGLMAGLTKQITKYSAKMFPSTHSEIGYYHQKGLGSPKREWWGVSKRFKTYFKKMQKQIKVAR